MVGGGEGTLDFVNRNFYFKKICQKPTSIVCLEIKENVLKWENCAALRECVY